MQGGEICLAVLHQHRLGDLDLEPVGRQAGRGQRVDHRCGDVLPAQLHRRDVDRHLDIVRPAGGIGAGLPQHPFAERHDQPGFFRDRDEFGGRDHAADGMVPADQRLAAADFVRLQIQQRLVMQYELAVADRLAQVHLDRAARVDAGIHLAFEEPVGAAPVGLGADRAPCPRIGATDRNRRRRAGPAQSRCWCRAGWYGR